MAFTALTQAAEQLTREGQVGLLAHKLAEMLDIHPSYVWITQIFIVIFLTLCASYFFNRVLKRLRVKLEGTRTIWDETLVEVARKPVRTGIWVVGLCYAMEIIYKETQAEIFSAVDVIRSIAIISLIMWWLLRFINTFEQNIITYREMRGEEVDHTAVSVLSKLLKASVLITGGLVMLQTLGFSISGVLAFGGIGGIAVGFAAKDILANFFGTITIYFDRPFNVGDWIRSPDKQIEGTVEHIGWRQTRIRTFERRPLYVPNSVFTTISVENPSRMSHRRIYEKIRIRYEDIGKMHAITDDVREMLRNHEGIDEDQLLMVHFSEYGESALEFMVYCFTRTTVWVEFLAVKHDVLLRIGEIIAAHDAQLALRTQVLHVPNPVELAMEQAAAKGKARK